MVGDSADAWPGISYLLGRGAFRKMIENRWLSVDEIAEYLGIRRDTVYKWIERKEMPAHKVGRLWKFKAEEIDEWVKSGGAAPVAEEKDAEGT